MTDKELLFIEVDTISDGLLRDFVKEVLENKTPDAFWTIPASSSGKHHPEQSNGEGGLVRHILAGLYFVREFCIAYSADESEKDICIASMILHDIGKAIAEPHDIVLTRQLSWMLKDNYDTYGISMTVNAVRWHMGKWSTGSTDGYEPGNRKFPEDFSRIEQIVHLADYAASRKRVNLTKLGGL